MYTVLWASCYIYRVQHFETRKIMPLNAGRFDFLETGESPFGEFGDYCRNWRMDHDRQPDVLIVASCHDNIKVTLS